MTTVEPIQESVQKSGEEDTPRHRRQPALFLGDDSGSPAPDVDGGGGSGDGGGALDGIAPAPGRARGNAVDYGTSGVSAPLSVTKGSGQDGPSIDDVPIPGVEKELENSNPYQAIVGYEKYSGMLLKSTQRHDQKIESYGRFVETDHRRISKLSEEYKFLSDSEADQKKKDALIDKVGGKKLPAEARPRVWTFALSLAEERSRLAAVARADADIDVPMVDGVYERARDAKKGVPKDARKTPTPAVQMQALTLGRAVREAKLSEGRLYVKTKELAHHKKTISDEVSTSDWWKDKAKFVGKKILGVGIGVATAGILGAEDAGPENTKKMGVNVTTLWGRVNAQLDQIDELSTKRPYGSTTSFHMAVQGYNVLLGEMRNVIAGIGTLLGLAAIPLALVAPPLAAVLKGIAVVAGLIALGLTLVKIAISAVLTTWSLIQRLASSNARKHQVQESQARSQAADVLSESASVAMSFAAPALGNAGELGKHGDTAFNNPLEQLKTGASSVAGSGPGGVTWANVGQHVATTGTSTASGIGTAVLGEAVIKDEMTSEMASHRTTPRAAVPQSHKPPVPPRPTTGPAALKPREEPAWLKAARDNEKSTLDDTVDQLVQRHQAQMGTFHDRTQTLMKHSSKLSSESDAATQKLDTAAKAKSGKKKASGDAAASTDRGGIRLAKALGAEMNKVLTTLDAHGKSIKPSDVREVVAGSG